MNEVQQFYVSLRMTVMSRQPGLTWDDVGGMNIIDFFHALRVSEKNSGGKDGDGAKISREQKRLSKQGG